MLDERTTWEEHPNIGGPASTLLGIHDQFRVASQRMILLVEREELGWLRRAFSPPQTLHHHHHAEEAMLFPFVKRRTGAAPTELVDDHSALTRAIAAVEEALVGGDRALAKAAVVAFDEVLVTHLDREERLVIPVLLHVTADEGWSLLYQT